MTPEARRWRTIQWALVGIWMTAIALFLAFEFDPDRRQRSPLGCAVGILSAFLHGAWITLDCKILNRRVGAWRFAGFFCGPLALWAYLLLTYGRKALLFIPISVAVYVLPIVPAITWEMIQAMKSEGSFSRYL